MAATRSDRQTNNAGQSGANTTQSQSGTSTTQIVLWGVAVFALFIVVLALVPGSSSVSAHNCRHWWSLICKADAHQGVIASVALGLAIAAGAFAWGSFSAERYAERRRQAAELQEKRDYRTLLDEMLYEAVHNLRHLSEDVGWRPKDLSHEYEGCELCGWPDLRFRYAERLLEVPYVSHLREDLPAAVGFLDHTLRNATWIEAHAHSLKDTGVAAHFAWLTEYLLRILVYACCYGMNCTQATARKVIEAAGLDLSLMTPRSRGLASVEEDIRDAVRLVKNDEVDQYWWRLLAWGAAPPRSSTHGYMPDGRKRKTDVFWFYPSGDKSELYRSFRELPDPPHPPKV